jgi:hypothetical protein
LTWNPPVFVSLQIDPYFWLNPVEVILSQSHRLVQSATHIPRAKKKSGIGCSRLGLYSNKRMLLFQ